MEEQELPAGWATAIGSEIFELVTSGSRGWAKYYSDDGPLFIRIGNLDHDSIELDLEEVQRVNPPDDSEGKRTRLEPNDILISITAELGMVALVPEDLGEAYVNQHVALARPSSEIDPRFLAWYLASESDGKKQLLDAKRGATKVGLGLPDIRNLFLPIAPLNEQRRIAAKLDTTLAAVESCRQRLDGVAELLKRFRQAVLAAATSGELTREWREERGLSTDSWAQSSIIELADQVFDGPFGSNLKSEDYTSDGFRVVRLENISHLRFLEEKRTFVSPEKFALLQKHVLFEDDILFSSFVDEEVRTCLLPSALSGVSINKADCFCIRVNRNLCLPGFVVSVLSCRSTFKSLDGLVHGATRPRINLKQLKSLSIALPPLEEQMEILSRQEQLFTLADQLEARLNSARRVVDRLTPALLAKAFRGELVPQDPSDEPASVLLDRIRAARQAESAAGKPSRRGRKPAAAHPEQARLGLESMPAVASDPLPPDRLAQLLQECGPLSEKALLAASELEPGRFLRQLQLELQAGTIREDLEEGERVLVGG